jgi:hypothetical protein
MAICDTEHKINGSGAATRAHSGSPQRSRGAPFFDFVFAFFIAVLLWGGFWLRDASVRALLPIRR